jgi:hypothetical protein
LGRPSPFLLPPIKFSIILKIPLAL